MSKFWIGTLAMIFNFQKAYAILDELIMAGEIQEPSGGTVLKMTKASDAWEQAEHIDNAITANFG
ncbi:hypothetical protein B0H34DRAFT_792563 [Crassisporium funariophilum]|nr:hypothetical protein B0H34DRAFT_792563 [Crassisporium funariophilum]